MSLIKLLYCVKKKKVTNIGTVAMSLNNNDCLPVDEVWQC